MFCAEILEVKSKRAIIDEALKHFFMITSQAIWKDIYWLKEFLWVLLRGRKNICSSSPELIPWPLLAKRSDIESVGYPPLFLGEGDRGGELIIRYPVACCRVVHLSSLIIISKQFTRSNFDSNAFLKELKKIYNYLFTKV